MDINRQKVKYRRPGLQATGQDGEWEVKVSNKNQKHQKQREARTGRKDAPHKVHRLHESAAILTENVQDDRARPREGESTPTRTGRRLSSRWTLGPLIR